MKKLILKTVLIFAAYLMPASVNCAWADHNGDTKRRDDLVVVDPAFGNIFLNTLGTSPAPPRFLPWFSGYQMQFGLGTDEYVRIGDVDGDRLEDFAVYRGAISTMIYRFSNGAPDQYVLLPINPAYWLASKVHFATGNVDNDGKEDLIVFVETGKNGTGMWLLRSSQTGVIATVVETGFNWSGTIGTDLLGVACADYSGDGFTELCIVGKSMASSTVNYKWRVTNLRVLIGNPSNEYTRQMQTGHNERPVVGRYVATSNGIATLNLVNLETLKWTVSTVSSPQTIVQTTQWGLPNDVVVKNHDLDGDKIDDPVVWRPTEGNFYFRLSSGGTPPAGIRHLAGWKIQWGLPGFRVVQ